MIVCLCQEVTEKEIKQAIHEEGVHTLKIVVLVQPMRTNVLKKNVTKNVHLCPQKIYHDTSAE